MSVDNRKREYERLVFAGKVPPENLVREFGVTDEIKKEAAKMVKKKVNKAKRKVF